MKKIAIGAAALFVIVLFAALLFPCTNCPGVAARKMEAKNLIVQISSAYKGYKSEYGSYPSGSFSTIIAELTGNNSRKIIFLEPTALNLDASGNPVDFWKTPLQFISESKDHGIQIISAGPDMKFGTQDDILNETEQGAAANP